MAGETLSLSVLERPMVEPATQSTPVDRVRQTLARKRVRPEVGLAATTTKAKRQAIDTFSPSFPARVDRNSVRPRTLKPCNSSGCGCVYLHRPTRDAATLKLNANQIPTATDHWSLVTDD